MPALEHCSPLVCRKLVENNSPNATHRKQVVEFEGQKTRRKLTLRIFMECKLVEQLRRITHKDYPVLLMDKFCSLMREIFSFTHNIPFWLYNYLKYFTSIVYSAVLLNNLELHETVWSQG